MCWYVGVFHPVDQAFNATRHCVTERGAEQTGDVSYRSNESTLAFVTGLGCMRLPKVTKLVQSKSGNLYLALQMARCGLCLGALRFRLQSVLLHEGGLWIMKGLLFR